MSGFIQAYPIRSQCTAEVVEKIKAWCYNWGFCSRILTDGGPCYRSDFEKQMAELGITAIKSSCYNPESNGGAERSVKLLKDQLKKGGGQLTQLQIAELLFAVNSRDQGSQGSPISRFLGQGTKSLIPNSLNRSFCWSWAIQNRCQQKMKLFKKKGEE